MTYAPTERNLAKLPGAVSFYRISAIITGVLLLLLCVEMILKYGAGLELELGGPRGFLALVPTDEVTAVNLSTGLLIVHGWFYVVYLFASFRLWSLMRWPLLKFLLMALGGIVPILSFILEQKLGREVLAHLAERKAGFKSTGGTAAKATGTTKSTGGTAAEVAAE